MAKMPLEDVNNSSALISQIAQLFRDKEDSDASLNKERLARRAAEEKREDAEEGRAKAENMKNAAEAECRKLEELKSIIEEQLEEERQRRQQSEKGVERMLTGLKDELLTPEQIARIEGDLRAQIASLQDAARKLRRDIQQEKVLKGKLEGNLQDLQGDIAKANRDRGELESELDDMRGRLKKMAELRSQIEAAKDQARKEVDEARRRAKDQIDDERANRTKAEDMYQDLLKEVHKSDQERRETGMMIEGLQRELDAERQKGQKLEEQKDILDAGRKEKDRAVAHATATLDNTNKELEEVRKDCARLRNMLDDEKKQRDVAEEAWKEYSKRLHAERISYTAPHGRLPDDEEIMDSVYDNLNGLERASSEEGELADYNLSRNAAPRALAQHQPTTPPPTQQQQQQQQPEQQQQSMGLPIQTRRAPNRRGRSRVKNTAPQRQGLTPERNRSLGPSSVVSGGLPSPSHIDGEATRLRSFPAQPIDPSIPPSQQPQPHSVFGQGGGFVQVPMHGMRNSSRPYSDMGNSSNQDDEGLYLNQSHASYPAVVHAREYQVQSPVHGGGRFGWTRRINPMRIRSNPITWLWVRRGTVTRGISSGTERVCHTTSRLAKSFWTWVVVLGLVAASVGLKDDEEEEWARNRRRRADSYDPLDGDRHSIVREEPVEYKAGSFVG